MPGGIDTLPDEDLKGNESDAGNVAQKHEDALVSHNHGQHDDIEGYDRTADGLDELENEFADNSEGAGGSLDDATPEERRAAIANQEAQQGVPDTFQYKKSEQYRTNSLGTRLKKRSASGSLLALMVLAFFGVGGGTTFLGSSLLVNIKEIFHNDRADATRANEIFNRATISHQISYSAAGCGTVAIKCRMGTMSDNQLKNFENADIKVKGDVFDTSGKKIGTYEDGKITLDSGQEPDSDTSKYRYVGKELTFADGKTVNSGSGFFAWTSANIKARAAALKAFNPRSAFYLNGKFNDIVEKLSVGFKKSKILTGKTKEEIDKSFNEQTGGASEKDLKSGKATTKMQEDAKGLKAKIGEHAGNGAAVGATLLCQSYNLAREGVATIKLSKMIALISFALPWFQAADQIKDQGSVDPEIIDNLSSRLTSYNTDKTDARYGLTATDSQGYAIAAYGDTSALKDFAQKWLLGNGTAASIENVLNTILTLNNFVGDKKYGQSIIKYACKALNNKLAAIVGAGGLVVSCLLSFFGNVVGPQSCLVGAAWLAAGAAASAALDEVGKQLIEKAAAEAADLNLGSDLNGVDAGNAIAAGAGLMLGASATSSGLRPSTSTTETQGYIASTDKINDEYIAAEQYAARDTPFDMNNRYSFLGSIVSNLQLAGNENNVNNPLFASVANVNSLVFSAFNGSGTANALYSQPAYSQKERYDCQDTDLQSIGVIGDKFCSISAIMPDIDLNAAQAQIDGGDTINNVIDWMLQGHDESYEDGGTKDTSFGGDAGVEKNFEDPTRIGEKPKSAGPSIDNNGKPVSGSEYALYLQYCTDARVTPSSQTTWDGENGAGTYWGTSTKPIEADSALDQDWYSGLQCTKDSKMMQMFRQYTNYCLQIATLDGVDNCWDATVAKASSTTTAPTGNIAQVAQQMGAWGGDYQACYILGGGHDSLDDLKKRIAAHFHGLENGVDCSGFTRAVIYTATGKDPGGLATNDMCTSSQYEHIPRAQAQPGDLAIRCDSHVEVITDVNGGNFKTVGSHTTGCGPSYGPSPGTEQGGSFVLRFKG